MIRATDQRTTSGLAASIRRRKRPADEVYVLSTFVLFPNGIVPDDAALGADNLARISMPNRDGLVSEYPSPGSGVKPRRRR
jgi:hypothetical protein